MVGIGSGWRVRREERRRVGRGWAESDMGVGQGWVELDVVGVGSGRRVR